jgi:S-adenosylmethionine:tRNA ribosyltransferase-isomerase
MTSPAPLYEGACVLTCSTLIFPERIALRPAVPRDAARLLVVRPGANLEDRIVRDLPNLLRPGDALVVNDTKVIPARLRGRRIGRGAMEPAIEATLHRRIDGARWRAFVKPAKRLAPGDVVRFGEEGRVCFLGQLDATVEDKGEGGEVTLAFAFHGPVLDQAVDERGAMPLPPYIAARRAPDDQDRTDYQTMFAQAEGSIAAPTASLHFTDALLERLRQRDFGPHRDAHVEQGPSFRSRRPIPPSIACMPRRAASARRPPPRSTRCGAQAAASSRSARPRCG